MTLFSRKNRDMPTLSLKVKPSAKARGVIPPIAKWARGSVCVPLFLFILVLSQLITTPLFAQDLHNRTEEMFRLGKVIISTEPLPDKVYESQKNKFMVNVFFFEKGTDNIIASSGGTGFMSPKTGVVLTARHVLSETIKDAEAIKAEKIKTKPKFDYDITFMGTIITPTEWVNFPLYLAAIGKAGTTTDIMALRVDASTMAEARSFQGSTTLNPLRMLLIPSELADAKLGEKVYITGLASGIGEYDDENHNSILIFMDLINHTFPAEVQASIPDMPGNRAGVKLLHRLHDGGEPGFSGGKVINTKGQVIGITVSVSPSRNFIYAISSKDIEDFLKENKIK